jgi:hypothetical protein
VRSDEIVDDGSIIGISNPEELAAAYATDASLALELATDETYADRRAGLKTFVARGVGVLAAAAVLLAAGMYWSRTRELRALQEQRQAISSRVASASANRMSRAEIAATLRTLENLEAHVPHWSAALAEMATTLPSGAYVSTARGRGDSLTVEGIADHAGPIFPAVQKTTVLTGVTGAGPIRREAKPNAKPVEHFSLLGRLSPKAGGTPDSARPKQTGRVR